MQTHLFGRAARTSPVPDCEMWNVLRTLRASPALGPFRIWLIGSRVRRGRECSDIDLVLSPRIMVALDDRIIEEGLWYCRDYGLHSAKPSCVVDPCFRESGPVLELAALRPETILKGVKLFSPKAMQEVSSGKIREFRRLGQFSIEFCRRAEETNYYRKLPKSRFDGRLLPYLRPAIEVLESSP